MTKYKHILIFTDYYYPGDEDNGDQPKCTYTAVLAIV